MQRTRPTPVFVAGITGSEPEHWQARWHAELPHGVWVEHASWDEPVRDAWVDDLDAALRGVHGPKVLVAHSLGCTVVTEWAATHTDDDIVAALLVAPPDAHGPAFPAAAHGFDAPRRRRLPFRTVVVTSDDDPYGTPQHAAQLARDLGAELVDVGPLGHINAESDLGTWPQGRALLAELLDG
ncbi:RBBP9/YdeN family alpha/beta hydrolase [Cellulomonas shaoxiangyii]|uniref:Alpha/beta hydrolase n=1 Tax=Cellulomonas shaoxiangyii TaxID=2566013 RepID=A0A4P7SEI1_9CELL|nr:alpha/beta hydrolase [Cellulomonas shaoxiangyii]QCB92240.1 alpha/beta hydrolase [Cellulomonas shaoxiangyii]TGY85948.1 alpha/beta hydrolase [Cellulomonas shaoxiangyii]